MSDERATQEHSYTATTEAWVRAMTSRGPYRRLTRREKIGRYVHRVRRQLARKIDPWGY